MERDVGAPSSRRVVASPLAEKVQSTHYKIIWENNAFVQCVVGANNCHLNQLQKKMNVAVSLRGNEVFLQGAPEAVEQAANVLNAAYDLAVKGRVLDIRDFELLFSSDEPKEMHKVLFTVGNKSICARNAKQMQMIKNLENNELNFALGAAGTGKTYLAVLYGLKSLLNGSVKRLILARPAVEAGEQLGFLPGDMRDKVDPYMRPLYDVLYEVLDSVRVARMIENNSIEVAPIAFMRGRTLSNSFIVLDEAQNATCVQMKMFLTRLGQGSRMVVTGDPRQVDLPRAQGSGLIDAVERLENIDSIGFVRFSMHDVVRHGLVSKIIQAYDGEV
ncbi:MAG: PhoH family protein [Alphaproteobacteria bacterium]|nr:PhoH family protein [Alphaproteobacteria bacterium]